MYYSFDALGNVTDLTDRTGETITQFRFSAFGSMYAGTLAPYNFMGLTGKHYDPKSGLVDFDFRWYDPQAGRFTQVDTFKGRIKDPGTQHPYAYVGNNPINRIDPTGHLEIIVDGDDVTIIYDDEEEADEWEDEIDDLRDEYDDVNIDEEYNYDDDDDDDDYSPPPTPEEKQEEFNSNVAAAPVASETKIKTGESISPTSIRGPSQNDEEVRRKGLEKIDRTMDLVEKAAAIVGVAAGVVGLIASTPVIATVATAVGIGSAFAGTGVAIYRTVTGYHDTKAAAAVDIGLSVAGGVLGIVGRGAAPITRAAKGLRGTLKQSASVISAHWSAATSALPFVDRFGWSP